MKTNGNRPNRRPINRTKSSVNQTNRTSRLSGGLKNRIGKPKIDLRQVLKKKTATAKSTTNKSSTPTSSDVKSRLGLQSATARLEAKREARAQLKSIKNKTIGAKDVKSQTQFKRTIQSSTVTNTNTISRPGNRSQMSNRKPTISSSATIRQDRERSSKDQNLTTRRPLDRGGLKSDTFRGRNERNSSGGIKSVTTQPIIIPQYIQPTPPPIVYPSQSHHSNYDPPTRYINRQPEINTGHEVMSSIGNSVLVSNLSPKINEDEVAELFGDIGPLMNVQIINSTTALVTYFASQHAAKAVKVYNYRLLDGIAMNCTVLPSTGIPNQQPTSQSVYPGRMYADSIPAPGRTTLRHNYHLGL